MREIFSDQFFVASVGDDGIVRLVRTAARIGELEEMRSSMDALSVALRAAKAKHSPRGILLDFRAVLPRNDERFEVMTQKYRQELQAAFGRIAVLIETAVGKLQMARLDRRDGTETAAFEDEAEALAYLLE